MERGSSKLSELLIADIINAGYFKDFGNIFGKRMLEE